MTPTKSEVVQRARELYFEENARHGDGTCISPEENELRESGFLNLATSELMASPDRKWEKFEQPETEKKPQVSNFESTNLSDVLQDVEFLNSLLRGGLVIFGASGCGKTVLAHELVKTFAKTGTVFRIIDPSRAWLDMGEVITVSRRETVYKWNERSTTVFDVCALNVNDKINFVNTLCGSLLESHMEGMNRNEIIVLEESELYLQNSAMRSKKCENIASLISMGRNFNLRYVAISQAPALIDKLFLKLTELKFCGFLSEPNDLNYLKKMLGKTWIEQIATLAIGEFVFQRAHAIQRVKVEIEKPRAWTELNFAYQYEPISFNKTKGINIFL